MNSRPSARPIVIFGVYKNTREITFYATESGLKEASTFGDVDKFGNGYNLNVDPLFDFRKVVRYLKKYKE